MTSIHLLSVDGIIWLIQQLTDVYLPWDHWLIQQLTDVYFPWDHWLIQHLNRCLLAY